MATGDEVPKAPKQEEVETAEERHYEFLQHRRNLGLLAGFVVAELILGGAYFLVQYDVLRVSSAGAILLSKLCRAGMFSILVLIISKVIDVLVIRHLKEPSVRHNLRRVATLSTLILVILIIVSIVFVNWYAAAVSIGLISLILGFALQTPITSFIGWIYILIRAPYRIGDRIQIDELRGDVIDVGYLDTTLWEFGGKYVSTDHPSGRLIKFPNSMVLNTPVINYSWHYFPYIWNEVKFQVAYQSDIRFVRDVMVRITTDMLGEEMEDRVQIYRRLLESTAIDCIDVHEKPTVLLNVNDNTWIEVIVRYLVLPREAGPIKSRLTQALLEELRKTPDRVLFPNSNAR